MSEAEALSDWLEATESCYGDGSTDCDMEQVYKMRSIYQKNKSEKTGAKIKCACCGKTILKASYQTQFCSNKGRGNCKDSFWNRVDSTRFERALKFTGRGGAA
jgi:hypothetical protein